MRGHPLPFPRHAGEGDHPPESGCWRGRATGRAYWLAIRTRARDFEENRDLVKGIVAEGCEKARDVARQTLEEVHQAMGMSYR